MSKYLGFNTTQIKTLFNILAGYAGGAAVWGSVDGTLADQTDLQNALNAKANSSSLGSKADQSDLDALESRVAALEADAG